MIAYVQLPTPSLMGGGGYTIRQAMVVTTPSVYLSWVAGISREGRAPHMGHIYPILAHPHWVALCPLKLIKWSRILCCLVFL